MTKETTTAPASMNGGETRMLFNVFRPFSRDAYEKIPPSISAFVARLAAKPATTNRLESTTPGTKNQAEKDKKAKTRPMASNSQAETFTILYPANLPAIPMFLVGDGFICSTELTHHFHRAHRRSHTSLRFPLGLRLPAERRPRYGGTRHLALLSDDEAQPEKDYGTS